MESFLVLCDHSEAADAVAQRTAGHEIWQAHVARSIEAGKAGTLWHCGRLLDTEGLLVGAFYIAKAPDRAAIEAWFGADPYAVNQVWRKVTVTHAPLVMESGQILGALPAPPTPS